MSSRSARNYWTDAELIADARENRAEEKQMRLRARSEWQPTDTLRQANNAKMRAESSEFILRRRQLDAEQTERAGVTANNR